MQHILMNAPLICMYCLCIACVCIWWLWLTCVVISLLFWRYCEFHRHRKQTKDLDAQLSRQLLQFYRTAGVVNTWLCLNLESDIDLDWRMIKKIIIKIPKMTLKEWEYWWHILFDYYSNERISLECNGILC